MKAIGNIFISNNDEEIGILELMFRDGDIQKNASNFLTFI